MQSDFKLTRISPPNVEAIHFYYDVTPESPDGSKVVYFEFGEQVFTNGHVMLADRAGREHRRMASVTGTDTHSAARAQWVDNDTVACCDGDPCSLRTVLISLRDGSRREMPGALRMVHPSRPVGLTCLHDFAPIGHPYDDCVHLMNLSEGTTEPLFTLGDAMKLHPFGTTFPGSDELTFMHTKWSGDGSRFFVMASNGHRIKDRPECKVVHAVFVADADGSNLRYVTEEYHHPMWGADAKTGKPLICYFQKRPDAGQDMMGFDPDDGRRVMLVERMLGKHACMTRGGDRIVVDVTNWPEKFHGVVMTYQPGDAEPIILVRLQQKDFSQRGCHLHPTWSRDEQSVYFNTSEPGHRSLWRADLGG